MTVYQTSTSHQRPPRVSFDVRHIWRQGGDRFPGDVKWLRVVAWAGAGGAVTFFLTLAADELFGLTIPGTVGFALASFSWFLMAQVPTITVCVVAIALFAVGEALQAPRYYGYVADLAPPEQVGTYMGFAFLPVAIGTFGAGALSGWLVSHYIKSGHPNPASMWNVVGGVGVVATVLLLAYDRFLAPKRPAV